MTMPVLTGDRLTQAILKIRPEMPILLCTGYSESVDARKALAVGARRYIEKPLELHQLATAVRDVLDSKR